MPLDYEALDRLVDEYNKQKGFDPSALGALSQGNKVFGYEDVIPPGAPDETSPIPGGPPAAAFERLRQAQGMAGATPLEILKSAPQIGLEVLKAIPRGLTLTETRKAAKAKPSDKLRVPFAGDVDVSKEGLPERVLADMLRVPLGIAEDVITASPLALLRAPLKAGGKKVGEKLLQKAEEKAGLPGAPKITEEVPFRTPAEATTITPMPTATEFIKDSARKLRVTAENVKHELKRAGIKKDLPKAQAKAFEEAVYRDTGLSALIKPAKGKTFQTTLEKMSKDVMAGKAPAEMEEALLKYMKEPTPYELQTFFVRSLPVERRLVQGMKTSAQGKAQVGTPLETSVTEIEPTVQAALGVTVGEHILRSLNRFVTPDVVFGTEARGFKWWRHVRDQEKAWRNFERIHIPFVEKITKGMADDALEKIGRALDGQVPLTELNQGEFIVHNQLRTLYNRLANELGLQPNQRISTYFPHMFDTKTGHPLDIIEIKAGQLLMDRARTGAIPFDQLIKKVPQGMQDEILKGLGSPIESVRARSMSQLIQATEPKLHGESILAAQEALKHLPRETFFKHTSFRRMTNVAPDYFNARDVTSAYIKGAARKIHLDRIMNDPANGLKSNIGGMSLFLQDFSLSYMDAFKGIDRGLSKSWALGLDKWIADLEAGGHKTAAKMASALYPRAFSPVVREWQFASKIAGNLATPLFNLSQTAINTVTELGTLNTGRAIAWYMMPASTKAGAQARALLTRAGIKYQATQAERWTQFGKPLDSLSLSTAPAYARFSLSRFSDIFGFLFRQSEEFNRGVAFLGAYRMARAQGKAHSLSVRIGQDIVDKTQFIFGHSNIPLLIQQPIGSLFGQFKTYAINQIRWYTSLLKGLHPSTSLQVNSVGRTNAQRFATGVLSTLAVGGASSMLPFYMGMDYIQRIKEKNLPEFAEDLIIGGLSRAGLRLDLSEQVGPAGVLPPFALQASRAEDVERLSREILGPTFSAIPELVANMNKWIESRDPDAALRLRKLMIRNIPGGVQMQRTALDELYMRGRRQRLTIPSVTEEEARKLSPEYLKLVETPKDRVLRKLFGARTRSVARNIEDLQYFSTREREMEAQKLTLEETILSNLPYYLEHPGEMQLLMQEAYEKYGVTPQELSAKLAYRGMPANARQYLTSSVQVKMQMEKEVPGMMDRIRKELTLFRAQQEQARRKAGGQSAY